MAGDLTNKYTGDAALTVTNLHSLATSSSWLAGWCSAAIDNSSTLANDVLVSGEIQVNTGVAPTAGGVILVLAFAAFRANGGSPVWPGTRALGATSGGAAYAGTEGTFTIVDTEQRDTFFVRGAAMTVDNNTSRGYGFNFSLRDLFGSLPPYCAIFIGQNTGQNLNSANNAVYTQPVLGAYT